MTQNSMQYIEKFKPFSQAVSEICGQFITFVPRRDDLALRFQQNREFDTSQPREEYFKPRERQHNDRRRGPKAPPKEEIQTNIVNGDETRKNNIERQQYLQSTSKHHRANLELQKIKNINTLKEKAAAGDAQAERKLDEYNTETALKRLRGEKVYDDPSLIKKSLRSQDNYRAKHARKHQEEKRLQSE